jgi:hypothetical protein
MLFYCLKMHILAVDQLKKQQISLYISALFLTYFITYEILFILP